MKILVDGLDLRRSRTRGIGTYLANTLEQLAAFGDVSLRALALPGTEPIPQVSYARVHRIAPGRWRSFEDEQLLPLNLAAVSRSFEPDVVWSPAQNPPSRCAAPVVQTLHDVVPLVVNDDHYADERLRWRRIAPRIRRATHVIAVSRFTADEGIRVLGLDPSRISVAPLGVSAAFRPADPVDVTPYLLLVAEYDSRKRLDHAFAVIAGLAAMGLPHRLVVVGAISPWFREPLEALKAASPRPDLIDLAGAVSQAALLDYYQQAAAVLVTSSHEGFGLPVLEAMASGTPVIAYSNSAITEVVGGAGVLIADGDVRAMTAAVAGLLRVDGDRTAAGTDLRLRGLARAAEYTWAACAAVHREVFAEASRG